MADRRFDPLVYDFDKAVDLAKLIIAGLHDLSVPGNDTQIDQGTRSVLCRKEIIFLPILIFYIAGRAWDQVTPAVCFFETIKDLSLFGYTDQDATLNAETVELAEMIGEFIDQRLLQLPGLDVLLKRLLFGVPNDLPPGLLLDQHRTDFGFAEPVCAFLSWIADDQPLNGQLAHCFL